MPRGGALAIVPAMRKIALVLALLFASLAAPAPFLSRPGFAQAPPPVPAEPDTERRTRYSGVTSVTTFLVGFDLYGDGTDYDHWLEVYVNGVRVTQSGNWTLTLGSGSLTTLSRPILGSNASVVFGSAQSGTIDIVGARRPRRTSQFAENRGVTARDLNQVITDLIMTVRERWDRIPRTMLAPPGENIGPLPSATSRANKLLAFDGSGNPEVLSGDGSGNVVGPVSAIDSNIPVFNGATGALIKDSGVAISNVPLLNAASNPFTGPITVWSGTAVPAGGTTGTGYKFSSVVNFGMFFGSGAPSLSAARGSIYVRSDGLPYYNTNGTTGWGQIAPLDSPAFTGTVTAPTAVPNTNNTTVASTAYADAIAALKANIASPTFTGAPAAPTATIDTNTTQLATTAFVLGQGSVSGDGTPAINGTAARGSSTHYARADHVHPTDTTRAPLASPALTGTPTAPTASPGTNSTQIASTAYADAIAALKANIASPTLTGTPTAPTASPGTNSTQLATTAYADALATASLTLTNKTFDSTSVAATQAARNNSTKLATTAYVDATTREILTGVRTYYVRTDGSDSNTGLVNSSGGAFLTLQNAINVAAALDSAIYDVTIQVVNLASPSTYTAAGIVLKNMAGAGKIIIVGDETTPANVVVACSSGDQFWGLHISTIYSLRGMKLTSASAGTAMRSEYGSYIQYQNLDFGAGFGEQIRTTAGGAIESTGNSTISGSAAYHQRAILGGVIRDSGRTITLTGTPNFTSSFAEAQFGGNIQVNSNAYTGSATGKRYNATDLGLIYTGSAGATYLPGNSSGTGTNAGTTPFGLYD